MENGTRGSTTTSARPRSGSRRSASGFASSCLGADPEVEETIKRTVQPYYVLEGNICALQTTKNHVNVFLYCGGIVPDPEGIVTDGHSGSTGRQIKIRQDEPINEKALVEMFQRIIANNRAGGWRKIKAERGLD